MDVIVMLKLYYGQKVILVTLLLIHKQLKILIQLLVDILCLSIQLGVLSCRRHNFNPILSCGGLWYLEHKSCYDIIVDSYSQTILKSIATLL